VLAGAISPQARVIVRANFAALLMAAERANEALEELQAALDLGAALRMSKAALAGCVIEAPHAGAKLPVGLRRLAKQPPVQQQVYKHGTVKVAATPVCTLLRSNRQLDVQLTRFCWCKACGGIFCLSQPVNVHACITHASTCDVEVNTQLL